MLRWWTLPLLLVMLRCFGQDDQVWLHPNRGQWDHRFNYKVELQKGEMLIEPNGFTYNIYEYNRDHAHDGEAEGFRGHVVKTAFIGASSQARFAEETPSPFYRNYFLSNDPSKWKSDVRSFQGVTSKAVYPGIDLHIQGGLSSLKYSWIVAPNTDASVIRWSYDGAKSVKMVNDELVITHSMGTITEGKPIAWTLQNGRKVPVEVNYKLQGATVWFELENTMFADTLIIDPSLTFSTFSGSTADNWGFTATPDQNGNLFGGGIVFGTGYPITTGALDNTYNGGSIDIGISKFSQDGSDLIFSTYIGGSDGESPHSIVCSTTGELFILGATASWNFPMAGASYDNTFAGGPPVAENGLSFASGTDIYIARLSAGGNNLIASTFIGGTSTDGINVGALQYNYGDQFRGEVIVDATNVYIASVTNSSDFPIANAAQASLNGPQDAVILKIDQGLSTLSWSTYFGGSGNETGNSLQRSSTGDIYMTGGTNSPSLPFSSGHDLSFNGGIGDGYIARLNNTSGAFLSGTYLGTSEYDQGYFVQVDLSNAVYVYGQTEGTVPVSPGCYGVANSGQFIMKYSPNLSTQLWTTVIGAGTGHVEISPTAFLVSNCSDIYICGWGGVLNHGDQAIFSTSSGFPFTSDAFQSSTNGSNFWIGVLDGDAAALKYATFMGGMTSSSAHVDGGTSRFDKNGSIYHAVCGSCGQTTSGFTTTPGSWSPADQSQNCNMAVFKFELSHIEAIVNDPEPLICLPDPVVFQNNSANGNEFFWDFGDNNFSTEINPSHTYAGPGSYTVTLIVTDSNECFAPDTVQFEVNIGDFQGGIVEPAAPVCPGGSFQFEAFGGANYVWSPTDLLDDPNIPNPTVTNIQENTLFTCIISDSCGVDTVQVLLEVFGGNVGASNDTIICFGNSVSLFVNGVASATWSPPTFLDDPSSTTPVSTPDNTITYTVVGTTVDGCELNESVTITVEFTTPEPVIPDTLRYCEGLTGTLTVSGATNYTWSPPLDIAPLTGPTVTISTQTDRYYYCDFSNACDSKLDSVFVDVVNATITAGNDTIVCPGEPASLWADGGVSYHWQPSVEFVTQSGSEVLASSYDPTVYTVTGTDENGCVASAQVTVDLYPMPFIQTCPDVYAFTGDVVQLSANSTTPGPFTWSPAEYLSCVNCSNPVANPDRNFVYTVSYTDENGCTASDDVRIIYDPIIYVPNTFTPNGDVFNETFFALGGNIQEFNIEIYNRWGERIYEGGALDKAWDGTYEGKECPDGVYTWKILYVDYTGLEHELVGHVSLLR